MADTLILTLQGKPVPRRDHSGTGKYSYDPQAKLKNDLRFLLRAQYHGKPINQMVRVDTYLYFPIPKSKLTKFNRNPEYFKYFAHRPDRDNCDKIYNDVLQPYVLKDDCLIVDGEIKKLYSEQPRVEYHITILGDIYGIL